MFNESKRPSVTVELPCSVFERARPFSPWKRATYEEISIGIFQGHQGNDQRHGGMEARAFVASVKYQSWILFFIIFSFKLKILISHRQQTHTPTTPSRGSWLSVYLTFIFLKDIVQISDQFDKKISPSLVFDKSPHICMNGIE